MNEAAVLTNEWIKSCEYQNGPNPDGTYSLWLWNGDKDLKVGDWYGGAKVVRIIHQFQALGEVQVLDRGYKGYVTFNREPGLMLKENEPDFVEWLEKNAHVVKLADTPA